MRLGVFGTGYAGLVTSVCFAHLGHTVTAVDKKGETVAQLAEGIPTIHEPDLAPLLAGNLAAGRLRFTTRPEEAMQGTEVVFLCVGTPPRHDGRTDLTQVEEVVRSIAPMLNGYTLIVEKSTVPARTAGWIAETIRRLAAPGREFDVASNPEFLREGSAVRDFLHPDRIVIGADSERARARLLDLYTPSFDCPFVVTSVTTAELIKQAANAFLATKISFVNLLADLCEALEIDVTTVATGVGLDPRIGSAYLQAGLGYGGSCLPKDVSALITVAEDAGVDVEMLRVAQRINAARVDRLLSKVERALGGMRDKVIGVLGVAFKPNTDDIRGAPSVAVVSRLRAAGARLRIFDPAAARNLAALHPADDRLTYADSAYAAAQDSDALVILTEWEEFRRLDVGRLRLLMRTPIIVDGRNLFDPAQMRSHGVTYYTLGRGDVHGRPAPQRVPA